MNRKPASYALAGTIFGIALAGFGVAAAQQDAPTTTASTAPTAGTKPAAPGPGAKLHAEHFRRGPGPGMRHKEFGPGGAIHGEFVVPDGNGGYRTMVTQTGEVTAVNASSITLKSADGFSKKYAVDENTLVNSGRDGIGTVKTGDTVSVQAVVEGATARAMHVTDRTSLGAIHDHWNPKRPAAGATTTTTRT